MTDEALAQRLAAAIEAKHTQLSRLTPKELPGVGNNTDVKTGQIFLESGEAAAFKLGLLVRKLHHYFQFRARDVIGPQTVGPMGTMLEELVAQKMPKWGFKPYDYREYQPCTNAPGPKGVAGNE